MPNESCAERNPTVHFYKDLDDPAASYTDVPRPLSVHCSLLLPLPFPLPSRSRWDEPSAADAEPVISAGCASQIRIVWSSEHDANMRSFLGFHATELTLPLPWPPSVASCVPESRCQMYTLPSAHRSISKPQLQGTNT
jgi:hypothetical protein